MPGTWGSLAALPCAWAITATTGRWGLFAASAIVFAVGCWAAGTAAAAGDRKDPGLIVIDEIAAQFLVLVAAPLEVWAYAAGFALFRVFDIWKPPPARWIERQVPGGLGIMLDDIVAALYAQIPLLIGVGALGVRP